MDMDGWPFETSWGLRGNPELTARYEVLKRIGEGNYGDVFQGRRKADNLVVALKEIHDQQSSRRELDALLRLDNPNVVKLLEYFRQGSSVVLVLEYAPYNLADVIAAGPLGEAVIKGIMLQLLQGLCVCHSASIVHRDLKPSNILLTSDGLLKIADFGNARILEEEGLDSHNEEQEPGKLTDIGSEGCSEMSSSGPVLPAADGDNKEQEPGKLTIKGSECCPEISTPEPVLVAANISGVARKRNYLQKLKGFLKKKSQHSQKPGQVLGSEDLGVQSELVGSHQQRSGSPGTDCPGSLSTHEVHQSARKVCKVTNSQAGHNNFDSVYGARSMEGMDQPASLASDYGFRKESREKMSAGQSKFIENDSRSALHTGSAGWAERSPEWSVPCAQEDSMDGWHMASGDRVLQLTEEMSGCGQAGIGRLEGNRWYGASEADDNFFDADCCGHKELVEQEPPWNLGHDEHPERKPRKGKDVMNLSNREQEWDGCVRADESESPCRWSDKSLSTSGIEDRAMDCRSDFTGCVGTRWYKSPEILYGATKYGKAIDLWAVGLIFAELLKGEPLFPGLSDIDQLSRIVKFLGPPTENTWPGVSELPDYDKISFAVECPPAVLNEEFPTASKMCLKFLENFLVYNPVQRLTTKEALGDIFFSVDPIPALPHEMEVQSHQLKAGNSQEWSD